LERNFGRKSHEERWQEEMLGADVDVQAEVFGRTVDPIDEEETIALTRDYVAWRFGSAHDAVDSLGWLRIDRIGGRILDADGLSAAEHLWLRLLISGHGAKDARYVVIDEVQDYTRLQLMVLARYFRGAHFLMLGDPNQAIREGTASWEEIREIFAREVPSARPGVPLGAGAAADRADARSSRNASTNFDAPSAAQTQQEPVVDARLQTSYRSSPEITALFASLLPEEQRTGLSSVQEAGRQPTIRPCGDDYLDCLGEAVRRAHEREGLTALICAERSRVRWLARQLGEAVTPIGRHDALPGSGVVVLDLALAKGLEFDCVIIPDAQQDVYPDTPLARRRLYTAISRATHEVEVFSQGALSPLLA
jgi:DNA helicase-2/ATP-dependent DNA helicase PcrA